MSWLRKAAPWIITLAVGLQAAGQGAPPPASENVRQAILAGLPKYDPTPAVPAEASPVMARAREATGDITSLPAVTVSDTLIPTERTILTNKGNAERLIDRYLGPADGLDRSVLNRFTLAELWKKIPLIGGLPFVGTPGSMTNVERALDRAGTNDRSPAPPDGFP